jgi:hypothetical protein
MHVDQERTAPAPLAPDPRAHRHAGVARLTVNRTNLHIYASVISGDGAKVLASASTAEKPKCASNSGARARVATSLPHADRQAHRREGQGCRRREGRVRPRGFCLPRPRQGAGRCRARSRPAVLSASHGKQTWQSSTPRARRRSRRRPARKDDRGQPRDQGRQGRSYPGFAADRGRRRRRPRRHGQGQGQGSAGAVQKAMEEARRNMTKVSAAQRHDPPQRDGRARRGQGADGAGSAGYRHHRRRPDARCVRSDGHHRHRGQEPWFDQPLQHGSCHAGRLKNSTTPAEVAAKRGKTVEELFADRRGELMMSTRKPCQGQAGSQPDRHQASRIAPPCAAWACASSTACANWKTRPPCAA